jgi:hypothetical protein
MRANGGGLKEYAASIGNDSSHITKYRNAAKVFESINGNDAVNELLDKAMHLNEISNMVFAMRPIGHIRVVGKRSPALGKLYRLLHRISAVHLPITLNIPFR